VIAQLLCLPLGRCLAAFLPTKCFNTFGYIWSLNPGPFSIKEHVCISVMVCSTNRGVYSNNVTLTQHVFYGQATPMSFQILLALGTQIMGLCLGGLLHQFVVWPSSMIWPGVLGNCAFFNTLHKNHDQAQITRKHVFWVVMAGSFVWYWVPGYLFTGLSMFNWVCWIAPKNIAINVLFGTNTGMGMSTLTFDWAMISSLFNPLVIPVGHTPLFYLVYCSHWVISSGGPK
jgi:OPT oligopeptide transporter protein